MTTQLLNPAALPHVPIYHQVAVTDGARTIYVAGQVAVDADGTRIGDGDLAAQVAQVYLNLHAALAAAGARLSDLVKVTAYLVDWRPEKMADVRDGMERAARALGVEVSLPPLTGVGVAALAEPGLLVEVDGVAVLP
ncbi:RidA family protein [Terrabacter aeriphilus]|uniref:RidA family protein n=1 Tax=Terrabacter aeriphilus TaxID=515662 RepID=A0ABP9J8E6_9MICO